MSQKKINYVVLDIGSSKIAGIAQDFNNSTITQVLVNSEGFTAGNVVDLQKFEDNIISAISKLEKQINNSITDVSICFSGAQATSHYFYSENKVEGHQVTNKDVNKLMHQALSDSQKDNLEIIHYFPMDYNLDGIHVKNPIGMRGNILGSKVHLVSIDKNMLNKITQCFTKLNITIEEISFAPYVSGIACLKDEELEQGTLFIDFGAFTTSLCIFLDNKLIRTDYINIGSWYITSDISKVFSTSLATAEKLKILHANLLATESEGVINLEEFNAEEFSNGETIKLSDLNKVILPRVEEIIEIIKEKYFKLELDYLIANKIVISGSGALISNLESCASQIFQKQVRVIAPNLLNEFDSNCNIFAYGAAIGLAKHELIKNQKKDDVPKKLIARFFQWIKLNI